MIIDFIRELINFFIACWSHIRFVKKSFRVFKENESLILPVILMKQELSGSGAGD